MPKLKGPAKPATPRADVRIRVETGQRHPPKTREERASDILADQLNALKLSLKPDGGYQVRLWRHNPATKDDDYLGRVPLEDFSLDAMMEQYGGGQYGYRVADATGLYVKHGQPGMVRFSIAGMPKYPDGSAAEGHGGSADIRMMLSFLKDLALEKNKGSGNVGEMALQMATAMATVQQTSINTALQLMKSNEPKPTADLMTQVSAVLDLAERLKGESDGGGGGGSDPLLVGAFQAAARALERVADNQRTAGAVPIARHAPPQPAALQLSAAPTAEEPMNPPAPDLAPLAPFVHQLVKLAQRDSDPELYADVLLDQLSDHPAVLQYLGTVKTAHERAQLQQRLALAFPETQTYAGWFVALWTAVWAALDAEDDPAQVEGDHTPETDIPPARE